MRKQSCNNHKAIEPQQDLHLSQPAIKPIEENTNIHVETQTNKTNIKDQKVLSMSPCGGGSIKLRWGGEQVHY